MLNRPTARIAPGGDVMQMESTRRALQKRGHTVDVSLSARPDLSRYDIAHVFNMQSGTMPHSFFQISCAAQQEKPVVLSTIYWSHDELELSSGGDIQAQGRARWKRISALLKNHPRELPLAIRSAFLKLRYRAHNVQHQKSCLQLAQLLLPNTAAEKELLIQEFQIADSEKFRIIPNAADSSFLQADPAPFVERFGLRDFVLCVARIEPRKNQLQLLEAVRELDLPAVFIGKIERSSPYARACLEFAGPKVLFIDHLPHAELAPAYAAAKVHVLPSWYETPGISSLEAGLAGANIVTTSRGGTREYFEDYAFYCEPDDLGSIREAVRQAFEAERTQCLQHHIRDNFTWERVAQLTEDAYREVLSDS